VKIDTSKFLDRKKFAEFSNEYTLEKEKIKNSIEDLKKEIAEINNNIKLRNTSNDETFKKIEG